MIIERFESSIGAEVLPSDTVSDVADVLRDLIESVQQDAAEEGFTVLDEVTWKFTDDEWAGTVSFLREAS